VESVANPSLPNPDLPDLAPEDISFVLDSFSNLMMMLERCSITLLTLSTPCTCTCRICGRKKIDDSVFTEDREWCELVFVGRFKDIKGGILEVEKCLYCDGEWIRKI